MAQSQSLAFPVVVLAIVVAAAGTFALSNPEQASDITCPGPRAQTLTPAGATSDNTPASVDSGGSTGGVQSSIAVIPSAEIRLDTSLPSVGSWDVETSVEGTADGRLAVLVAEEFLLRCLCSTDGGRTFPTETNVLGQAGQPPVHYFDTAMSSSGRLHVGAAVVDPSGDHGLQHVRSDDVGQTWTAPLDLVQYGDPGHGVHEVAAAAGATDQIALIFRGNRGRDPYVVASSDAGATWTTPQRIDTGIPAGSAWTGTVDVAVDDSGNIYAVYTQTRAGTTSVWYTRSIDGGVSFDPETSLEVFFPAASFYPDVEVADNGDVLIAVMDYQNLHVVRSRNDGASYSVVYDYALGDRIYQTVPRLAVARGTSTVLLLHMIDWQVEVHRSTSNGRRWDGTPQVFPGSALQSLAATRTGGPTPTWVVAWSDYRSDSYAGWKMDVYARSSTDEGATWSAEQRVDKDLPGAAASIVSGVADAGSDEVFVLFRDTRSENGCGWDLCANQAPAGSLTFGTDYLIGSDAGTTAPMSLTEPTLATDGASGVYAAFTAWTTGHHTDVHVAASSDGGYTFGAPVRVGDTPSGTAIEFLPTLAATSDGYVYLTYISDTHGFGGRELRLNRSADYGQTWLANDIVLTQALYHDFLGYRLDQWMTFPGVSMVAQPGGTVYVAYSDRNTVWLARSDDGGLSFDTQDVDQNSAMENTYPRLCAQGSQLVLIYRSQISVASPARIWGVVSSDGGDNWGSAQELQSDLTAWADAIEIACSPDQRALAVWADLRTGGYRVRARLFDGTTWQGEQLLSGPAEPHLAPRGVYATANDVVVAYVTESAPVTVHVSRSTDGGVSFPTHQQLDDALPDPDALSKAPLITTDRAGNVWVAWFDHHAGRANMVVRHSADAGATYGPPLRLDSGEPEGGYDNIYWYWNTQSGSLPGVGFFTWSAERDHNRWGRVLQVLDYSERELNQWGTVLLNAHDVDDLDRDRSAAGVDCDDNDDSVWAAPGETTGIAAQKLLGATRLSWTSQDASAGPSTSYDIVAGLLGDLLSVGYGSSSCLVNGHPDTPYDDTRPDPTAGDGYYYLLRAKNGCGTGSYGDSSLSPDPRDGLDTSGPCP